MVASTLVTVLAHIPLPALALSRYRIACTNRSLGVAFTLFATDLGLPSVGFSNAVLTVRPVAIRRADTSSSGLIADVMGSWAGVTF